MSLVLRASVVMQASPQRVWDTLVDWPGQSRWIPFTTVRTRGDRVAGVGTSVHAFSGFEVLGRRFGLPDNFVVTTWSPPRVLEVLHLGPAFRGEGEFRLTDLLGSGSAPDPQRPRTQLTCTESFTLPGGSAVEAVARIVRPIMTSELRRSLRTLKNQIEMQEDGERR